MSEYITEPKIDFCKRLASQLDQNWYLEPIYWEDGEIKFSNYLYEQNEFGSWVRHEANSREIDFWYRLLNQAGYPKQMSDLEITEKEYNHLNYCEAVGLNPKDYQSIQKFIQQNNSDCQFWSHEAIPQGYYFEDFSGNWKQFPEYEFKIIL